MFFFRDRMFYRYDCTTNENYADTANEVTCANTDYDRDDDTVNEVTCTNTDDDLDDDDVIYMGTEYVPVDTGTEIDQYVVYINQVSTAYHTFTLSHDSLLTDIHMFVIV